MGKSGLELTAPEAGVALAALVSFSDDDPSDAEGVVLRKYYRYATAESLQKKCDSAGYHYPHDLPSAEETIVRAIGSAPESFRMRTLAVAWLLALADGRVDQNELRLLSRYADALGISLADARTAAERGLPEIDETTTSELDATAGWMELVGHGTINHDPIMLSPEEAATTLCCTVAFSDDDPSDAEAAVMREHFGADAVEQLINRLNDSGYRYPGGLADVEPFIIRAMERVSRDEQIRILALASRVADADGRISEDEEAILRSYCEHFAIGMAEVRGFFRSTV